MFCEIQETVSPLFALTSSPTSTLPSKEPAETEYEPGREGERTWQLRSPSCCVVCHRDKKLTAERPDKWGFLLRKKMAPAGKPEMKWRDRVRAMRSGAPMSEVLADDPPPPYSECESSGGGDSTFMTAVSMTMSQAEHRSCTSHVSIPGGDHHHRDRDREYQPPPKGRGAKRQGNQGSGPRRPSTATARPGSAMQALQRDLQRDRVGIRVEGRPQTAMPAGRGGSTKR